MYRHDMNMWNMVYEDFLSDSEKEKIISVLKEAIKDFEVEEKFGKMIENRESQITISMLGQEAPIDKKKEWDRDKDKRQKIINKIKDQLSDFEIHIAGTTSIDITKKGIDKAYGINKMVKYLEIPLTEILFIGDALNNGNDSPVKSLGVSYKEVKSVDDTKNIIKNLLNKRK